MSLPLNLSVSLNYRKFNKEYTAFSLGNDNEITLPVIQLSEDNVLIEPISADSIQSNTSDKKQLARLLDYGIGLFRKPNNSEFKQAEKVFRQVYTAGELQGGINLVRLLYAEGRLEETLSVINQLRMQSPYNEWTLDWYESLIAREYGEIETSIELLNNIIASDWPAAKEANLDFSKDDKVILALAEAYFSFAQLTGNKSPLFDLYINSAEKYFTLILNRESENSQAHYGMWKVARILRK